MKQDMRDGETTHAAIGSDKLIRDQELQHLVTSSIPSPPFSGLSLINTSQGIQLIDPIYSAHLLATFAASNPGARFQLPIPIPMSVPASATRIYDYSATLPVSGLTAATIPNAQLEILSSWVHEQATNNNNNNNNKQRKMSGNKNNHINNNNNNNSNNNNNRKRGTNASVNKTNKKNKSGALISSENGVAIPTDTVDNAIDMNIKPTIIPIDKTPKIVRQKKFDGEDRQPVNNNNNNNANKASIQHQQSNQQSRDKVFTCPICNRCFGYKHVLQNHERTHTGEKPYFCKICNKRFTRDHHLKTHMRLHTGEKPYNCTHCDKQFVQVANLRRHLRVHTGERPYSCELCDARFSDSNQLKAHMLIHKGQKPYYCEVCTMRFRRRHHLTQHKCVKNSEEQPFPHSPPDISPPASNNKRERKSRETRRIIRVAGLPVATVTSTGLESFMPVVPEQTHPEDLSVGSGGALGRNRSYSGSHSSVSASPSPSGGSRGSLGSLGPYCHSVSSNEHTEYYSDEERSGTADSSTSPHCKNDSDEHLSPSQG